MNESGPNEERGEEVSHASVIGEICDGFESAWQAGERPRVEEYLSRLPETVAADARRELLRELVMIDLECRWRTAHLASPSADETRHGDRLDTLSDRPLIEDYVSRFSELGPLERVPDDLIAYEYSVRHEWGDKPSHDEYSQRFADQSATLVERLSQIDRELGLEKKPAAAGAGLAAPTIPPGEPPTELPTIPPSSPPMEDATVPPSDTVEGVMSAPGESSAEAPAVGTNIRYFGDYELLEEIARGGMGVVYKARQVTLNRIVALKMILAGQLAGEEDVQRFHAEAEAAAGLDHPGIVPIFEIGEHEGQHYFSMGFVEGESLSARIRNGPLPPREAAEYTNKVAEAVAFAHEQGVIHRDLKPANVLLKESPESRDKSPEQQDRRKPSSSSGSRHSTLDCQPMVTDFGLAKKVEGDSGLTATGQILGTPGYMPPEQAAGKIDEVTETADVYSLGAILYNLLTARPPFQADNPLDTLMQVLEQEPVSPHQLNSKVPRDLETITLKCLDKDSRRRYGSAQQLVDELQRFLNGEPIHARPISTPTRVWRWCRRKPVVAGLSAITLLLLVAVAVVGMVGYITTTNALETAKRREVEAHAARQAEADQRRVAETTVVDMQTTMGLVAAERGNPQEAVLWFASAAANSAHDRDRELANRVRFQNWSRELPVPVSAFRNAHQPRRIVFHPGGRYLMVHDRRPSVTLWELENEKPVTLLPNGALPTAAAWNPTGDLLAVGTAEGVVEIHEFPSGKCLHKLSGQGLIASVDGLDRPSTMRPIVALSFSNNGRYLAVGSGGIWVWDCDEKRIVIPETALPKRVVELAFNRDSSQLVATSADRLARVYALAAEESDAKPLFEPISVDPGNRPVFLAHDDVMVVRTPSGELAWCNTKSGVVVRRVSGSGAPGIILPCQNGNAVLTTGYGTVRLFRAADGQSLGEFDGHHDFVCDAAFSPDERALITVSADRTARLWSTESRSLVTPPVQHQKDVWRTAFSSDGQLFATVQSDGLVRIWRAPAKFESLLIPTRVSYARWVMSDDGRHIAPAGFAINRLQVDTQVYELPTGKEAGPILRVDGLINQGTFTPDGSTLITLSSLPENCDQRAAQKITWFRQPGWVIFWNWQTGQRLFKPLLTPTEPLDAACTPDGKLVIVACAGGEILLVELSSGSIVKQLNHGGIAAAPTMANPKRRFRLGPKGGYFATMLDEKACLWETSTGRRCHTVAHKSPIQDACFSSDERWLATSDMFGTASIWDTKTGELAANLPHPNRVFSIEFSPDDLYVVTACRDGMARFWNWRTGPTVCSAFQHGDQALDARFIPGGRWVLSTSRGNAVESVARLWDSSSGKAISPPLELLGGRVLFSASLGYGVIHTMAGARVFDLKPLVEPNVQGINSGGLRTLGEILSGRRIQAGGSIKLTSNEWLERWQSFECECTTFRRLESTGGRATYQEVSEAANEKPDGSEAEAKASEPQKAEGHSATQEAKQSVAAKATSPTGESAPALAIAPFGESQAKRHQREWADYLGVPLEREIDLPGGKKLTMVLIPPGEFLMGSTDAEQARLREEAKAGKDGSAFSRIPSEGPQHRVRITRPFYLGKCEVTQAQWQAVMGSNPSRFEGNPALPVEQVSWDDVQRFLAKLNEDTSAEEMEFAFPTEAQWEFACRAGTTTFWHSGESEAALQEHGWFAVNSGGKTHPVVGQLRPNGFGLHDMLGNVWEWCADWFAADYYSKAPVEDPSGGTLGSRRVIRGGAGGNSAWGCRSAIRGDRAPGYRSGGLGFRVASVPVDASKAKPAEPKPDLTVQDARSDKEQTEPKPAQAVAPSKEALGRMFAAIKEVSLSLPPIQAHSKKQSKKPDPRAILDYNLRKIVESKFSTAARRLGLSVTETDDAVLEVRWVLKQDGEYFVIDMSGDLKCRAADSNRYTVWTHQQEIFRVRPGPRVKVEDLMKDGVDDFFKPFQRAYGAASP